MTDEQMETGVKPKAKSRQRKDLWSNIISELVVATNTLGLINVKDTMRARKPLLTSKIDQPTH